MPCLVGCDSYKTGCLRTPIDADSLSPWAAVTFLATTTNPSSATGTPTSGMYNWFPGPTTGGAPSSSIQGKFSVTVGNQSAPASYHHNTAAIKSFKYGSSVLGGCGCEVEITDEKGTMFEAWMDKLNRSLENAATRDYKMAVQFGWTASNCDGSRVVTSSCGTPVVSPVLYFLPQNITSIYEGGKMKYKIQGLDMMQRVFESRGEETHGSTDYRMTLKNAIRQLFADNIPAVPSVRFLRRENSGSPSEWGFKDGGMDGTLGKWSSDQQNALATTRKWFRGQRTDRDKGITASWNSASPQPEVIFWEDPFPGCNENVNPEARSLGTFIVNGGNCSPVVSFAPSVQWNCNGSA